jgi:hypothetical protein
MQKKSDEFDYEELVKQLDAYYFQKKKKALKKLRQDEFMAILLLLLELIESEEQADKVKRLREYLESLNSPFPFKKGIVFPVNQPDSQKSKP